MSNKRITHSRGFSLIEMIVSVALFAVIMLIAIGALLTLVDATRKARSLESVMNNLNISLDSMVRAIRQGTEYNCGSTAVPLTAADCASGGTLFSFAPYGANPATQPQRWVYEFTNGQILKSEMGGVGAIPITAPEVLITDMDFYVVGTARGDTAQPKVVIVIKGRTGASGDKTSSTFYIQATAVQRVLDI